MCSASKNCGHPTKAFKKHEKSKTLNLLIVSNKGIVKGYYYLYIYKIHTSRSFNDDKLTNLKKKYV